MLDCRLQGTQNWNGTARVEAMSVLERDFPASLQHSEIAPAGGREASITTAGKTLLQSLPPCSQLGKALSSFGPTQKAFLATIVETFLAKLLACAHKHTHKHIISFQLGAL